MLVIGLDGKEYKINFGRYASSNRAVSSGHKRARVLLQAMYTETGGASLKLLKQSRIYTLPAQLFSL